MESSGGFAGLSLPRFPGRSLKSVSFDAYGIYLGLL